MKSGVVAGPSLLGLVLASVSLSANAQSTWRVPGHFGAIEEAVRVAMPGDTILLTGRLYVPLGKGLVVDKGLVIEPEAGRRATIGYLLTHDHAIKCTGLVGAPLILRNLDIVPGPPNSADARARVPLEITLPVAERGEVVLDAVKAEGLVSNQHAASAGLVVNSGPDVRVVLRNCVFRGASGDVTWLAQGETGWRGSPGGILNVQGPALLDNTDFEGGPGGDSWGFFNVLPPARDGAPGIIGNATALTNCFVKDGNGGNVYVGSYVGSPDGRQGRPGVSMIPGDHFEVRHQPAREGWISNRPRPPDPPLVVLGERRKNLALLTQQVWGRPFPVLARSVPPTLGQMFLGIGVRLVRYPFLDPPGAVYVDGALTLVPMTPAWEDHWHSEIPGDRSAPVHATIYLQAFTYRFDTGGWQLGSPGSFTLFAR